MIIATMNMSGYHIEVHLHLRYEMEMFTLSEKNICGNKLYLFTLLGQIHSRYFVAYKTGKEKLSICAHQCDSS